MELRGIKRRDLGPPDEIILDIVPFNLDPATNQRKPGTWSPRKALKGPNPASLVLYWNLSSIPGNVCIDNLQRSCRPIRSHLRLKETYAFDETIGACSGPGGQGLRVSRDSGSNQRVSPSPSGQIVRGPDEAEASRL